MALPGLCVHPPFPVVFAITLSSIVCLPSCHLIHVLLQRLMLETLFYFILLFYFFSGVGFEFEAFCMAVR